jgi:hypothetical protein
MIIVIKNEYSFRLKHFSAEIIRSIYYLCTSVLCNSQCCIYVDECTIRDIPGIWKPGNIFVDSLFQMEIHLAMHKLQIIVLNSKEL